MIIFFKVKNVVKKKDEAVVGQSSAESIETYITKENDVNRYLFM